MLDWSECPAVERLEGKVSGALVFRESRVLVRALFENLEGGATIDEFLSFFPGIAREQVTAVLLHAQQSLERAESNFLPSNCSLPFLAYGVFRPGELAFLRIKPFVAARRPSKFPGKLRLRDGLPIAELGEPDSFVEGDTLEFSPFDGQKAYCAIAELEPQKQYQWRDLQVDGQAVNILVGRSPGYGSSDLYNPWRGQEDPLFTDALDVVQETLQENQAGDLDDLKPLFRLEMAYLLLWTAIERYASLRYHLGTKVANKVFEIATETAFRQSLSKIPTPERPRSLRRADDPKKKVTWDPSDPGKSLRYYYQLRSNLVHRGKGVIKDHNRVRDALTELLELFRFTLKAAFEESARL